MEQFTKSNLAEIRAALNESLKNVEDKFGIKLSVGNIRFADSHFSTKLEAKITNEKGESLINDLDYSMLRLAVTGGTATNLPPINVVREGFMHKGKRYKVTAFKTRGRMGVQLEAADGSKLRCTPDCLLANLKQ